MTAEAWTYERIREAFIYDGGEAEYHDPISGAQTQRKVAGDIFDTWLAAHDAALLDALSTPPADDVREALTSVEELEALPTRSVVMDGSGEVWRKTVTGLWDCLDGQGDQPVEESATVLWQSAPPRVTVLWASGEVRPRGTVTDAEVEAAARAMSPRADRWADFSGVARTALEAAREARS